MISCADAYSVVCNPQLSPLSYSALSPKNRLVPRILLALYLVAFYDCGMPLARAAERRESARLQVLVTGAQ